MAIPTIFDNKQAHGPQCEIAKSAPASKTYLAGNNLHYTLRGLALLCFWLLWGDFAFTFFEGIFGKFIPLYLKDLQAPNALIGIMTGSIAGLVNIVFLPNISQGSDNYRSRWGRRIPFLYVVTPLTVAFLVGIGFAPEIAGWFFSHIISHVAPSVAPVTVVLAALCIMVVFFHFFNMVLVNAYNWLLRDVVPLDVMPVFLSWFRVVGTASSSLFLWYVFPHVVSHRKEVCAGVGGFYLVVFLLMCLNVKEGDYPPPPAAEDRPGVLKSFGLYFKECFALSIYRNFFLGIVLANVAAISAGPFTVLFNRDTLGLSLDDMGKIFAINGILGAVYLIPMGWLCKKYSSSVVAIVGLVGQVIGFFCMMCFVYDKNSFFIVTLVFTLPAIAWGLGAGALTMELFPEEKFGQFSSGLNVFTCGTLILSNYLVGQFMDLVHSNYRLVYIWNIVVMAAAIVPMLAVYRSWKKYGGPDHYVAPLPPSGEERDAVFKKTLI